MQKKYLPIASLGLLLLSGCFDDNSDSSGTSVGGAPMDYQYSNTASLAKQSDTSFYAIESTGDCNETTGAFYTEADSTTVKYAFEDGHLLLKGMMGCNYTLQGGTMSQLEGNWTVIDATSSYSGDDDEECLDEGETKSVKISANSITIATQVNDYCWGEERKEYWEKQYASDTITISSDGCNNVSATDKEGNVFTRTSVSVNFSTGDATYRYTYNGKSCSITGKEIEASTSVCAEAWSAYQNSGESSSSSFFWYDWTGNEAKEAFNSCIAQWDVSEALKDVVY
jgi:hypothetical protein